MRGVIDSEGLKFKDTDLVYARYGRFARDMFDSGYDFLWVDVQGGYSRNIDPKHLLEYGSFAGIDYPHYPSTAGHAAFLARDARHNRIFSTKTPMSRWTSLYGSIGYIFYEWWWGSCNGCDSWSQRKFGPFEIRQDMRLSALHFGDEDALKDFLTRDAFMAVAGLAGTSNRIVRTHGGPLAVSLDIATDGPERRRESIHRLLYTPEKEANGRLMFEEG